MSNTKRSAGHSAGRRARIAGLIASLLVMLPAGTAFTEISAPQSASALGTDLRFGVYDPSGTFGSSSSLSIEHIYLPLIGVDLGSLRQAGNYAARRGRELLVTVEPWSWDGRWNLSNEEASLEIVEGKRDGEIVQLCKTVGTLPTPIILRWGHEMEAKTDRYAWTRLPPEQYIDGYRHFVALCRQHAPTARFMWSPLGEPDLVRYYPGDDVVDVIGLSVFALQAYERSLHGTDRNVAEIARERYGRVDRYGKPVFIAELGCSGDDRYERECISQMLALKEQMPRLSAVIYFNDAEPAPWPGTFGRPDWRLPPGTFAAGN